MNTNEQIRVIVSTRECVNLVTHTNFTVLCVIEADFWTISLMLEEAVTSSNVHLPNLVK